MIENKNKLIIKILLVLIFIILIILINVKYVNSATSVLLNDGKVSNGEYLIDCLGKNNELFLYGYEKDNPSGKLIFQTKCDNSINVKEQYIYQAIRLVIKNNENNDDRIDYEEYFDTIQDDRLNIKMDTFEEKVCFTIESKKYVDVSINNVKEEQVKKYYHCFDKSSLTANAKTGEDSKVVEVYINDKLKKEFVVSKPKEQLLISFQDLSFINKDLKDKINVKITNPSGKTQKISVIDTNLQCGVKSFTIGYEYMLLCNKTISKNSAKVYYIQLQDSLRQVYYKSYTEPPTKKSSNDNIYIYIGIGAVLILFIGYNTYQNKSSEKDKTAINQLEDEDN